MILIDHITYEVLSVEDPDLPLFFSALGLKEIEPAEHIAAQYRVRWWEDSDGFTIHLVERESAGQARPLVYGLGHFCVTGVSPEDFDRLSHSEWLEHDSGSGRIWLEGPQSIRVEVHPNAR